MPSIRKVEDIPLKVPFFIVMLIVVAFGVVFIILGSIIIAKYKNFAEMTKSGQAISSEVLIGVGLVIDITSVLGVLGVLNQSYVMLQWFAGIVGLAFLTQFGGGVAAVVKGTDYINWQDQFKDNMMYSLNSTKVNPDMKSKWDKMQRKYKCCGVVNHLDWNKLSMWAPRSCYTKDLKNKYTSGCFGVVSNDIRTVTNSLGYIAVGLLIFEAAEIMMALLLAAEY